MSMPSIPYRRHAFGWPAGSVRALLAFGVLGLLWAMVLHAERSDVPQDAKLPVVFVYLWSLTLLILAHFYAAHGSTIGKTVSASSPLGLPRGSVRFLLLAGYVGLSVYLFLKQPDFDFPPKQQFILLVCLLGGGFLLGHILSGLMRTLGGGEAPAWWIDFEAWISLLALIGMAAILVIHTMINPQVSETLKIDIPITEAGLAGIIGFYFGARS